MSVKPQFEGFCFCLMWMWRGVDPLEVEEVLSRIAVCKAEHSKDRKSVV